MSIRIALDTNQLVAALARPPELATFIMAWESRRFTVIASQPLLDEYEHVLRYSKVATLIYPELLRAYRDHLVSEIEKVTLPGIPRVCRDPDDDKVVATALVGRVDYLLTEDADLATQAIRDILARQRITILSGREFIRTLDKISSG